MPTFTYTGPQDLLAVAGHTFRRDEPETVTDGEVIAELREHNQFIEAAAFNGADPKAFDHDDSGKPGGAPKGGNRKAKAKPAK